MQTPALPLGYQAAYSRMDFGSSVSYYTVMLPSSGNPVKKAIFIVVFVLSLGLSIFLSYKIYTNRDTIFGYASLSANTLDGTAQVFLDKQDLGKTPVTYQKVKPGKHTVKLVRDTHTYETTVTFTANSQVVISRELGMSDMFSSGQDLWFDAKDLSSKLNVVSEPSDVSVFIDDYEQGKTPFSSTSLSEGQYDLLIEKEGYEAQEARIKLEKDMKLNVSVRLFAMPVPSKPALFDNSKMVYDLSTITSSLTTDVPAWIKGIIYFVKTRGLSTNYSYFLDFSGKVYDAQGNEVTSQDKIALKVGDLLGYLGRSTDKGMTEDAKKALERFTGLDLAFGKKVKVLATPTGWLRVRDLPGLDGKEVARVNPGDILSVLEEKTEWIKVAITAGEGWVSSAYLEAVK